MGDIGHAAERVFPLIQTKPVPSGDASYESMRAAIKKKLHGTVPEHYYIPQKFVDDPPEDVTAIPRASGVLDERELEITENYDAVGLATAIANKKYKAVEVALAFCKRAIVCHQITCCLTQWFPKEAMAQAKTLDDHLERTGKTIGPLHGVPISIKEHIQIKGRCSSRGYVSTTAEDNADAHIVAILRKLGAVFYVKTMQPQSLMHSETDSHMGRVLNPYNIHLSAGGSTGGEAALIALRGSVMGVGSDLGGGVRTPAAFCGIYGFKPTAYTLPTRGFTTEGLPAELNILCAAGPMCRSLRDMDLFMHLILAAKPYLMDPRLVPIPWTGLKTVQVPSPLKIGIMMTDGWIQPQPPVTRALEWARSKLEACWQIEVKQFLPYKPQRAVYMTRRMYWPDGGAGIKSALAKSGEPMHPLSQWGIQDAESDWQLGALEITEMRVKRDEYRCAFAESWNEQDVDVVLCPAFVGPACAHDTSFYFNYTALWNFTDCPAVCFPTPIRMGNKAAESTQYAKSKSFSEADRHVKSLWNEGNFERAPINLQMVARRYHDNLLFGVLDRLKEALELK